MVKSLAHTAFHDIGEGDGAEYLTISRYQQGRASSICNLPDDDLDLRRNCMTSLAHVLFDGVWCTLPDFISVHVHAGHARLRGEGNKGRIVLRQLAAAQTVL